MSFTLQRSELLSYAMAFRQAMLQGASSSRMCAAVSAPLRAALIRLGVEAVLVESDLDECNHIFLKLLDGEILDPTADQFNEGSRVQLPEVYLGPGARIHTGAQPWAGGLEWGPFMEEIQRLVPSLAPDKVGRAVGLLLRSFPGRLEPARAPNQASL